MSGHLVTRMAHAACTLLWKSKFCASCSPSTSCTLTPPSPTSVLFCVLVALAPELDSACLLVLPLGGIAPGQGYARSLSGLGYARNRRGQAGLGPPPP